MHRITKMGPIVFTLVGTWVGICSAILYRQDPRERATVHLDDSIPFFLGGAFVGALVGLGRASVSVHWPRLTAVVGMVSVTLLCASISAPLGWIIGELGEVRHPREGMIIGAAVGGGMGLVLGITQVLIDRRKRSN